jgi:hypothetical protein
MPSQTEVDTLRGELREEKEVVVALEESKTDCERLLSKKIKEFVDACRERDEAHSANEQALPMPPDTLIKVGMLADVERHGDRMPITGISVTFCPRRDPAAEGADGEYTTPESTAVAVWQIEAALLPYAVFDLGQGGWCYGNQVRRVYNEDGAEDD